MAATDHGEVLTNLEEIFGTVVEHEVIKMILQSCDWDSGSASEMLLAMIDKTDLPGYAWDLLNADSLPQDRVRHSSCDSLGSRQEANRAITSDNVEKVMASPINKLCAIDSDSSSPSCSPLRGVGVADAEVAREHDTSQWVLAPEFVPNAFYQNTSTNGIWPLGMSRSLVHIPQQPTQSEAKQKTGKISKKDQIVRKVLQDIKILVLLRGLPGSGKTTLARELKGRTGVILSTDDFFRDKHGKYKYEANKLSNAHQWNKHRARQRLKEGKTPIIIDNTNIEIWEMKPYIKLALQFGYEVDIIDPDTPWRLNPKELAKRNIHGVPKSKIVEMKGRYKSDVKVEHLIADLQRFKLSEQNYENDEVWSCGPELEEVWNKVPKGNNQNEQQVSTSQLQFQANLSKKDDWSSGEEDEDADVIIEGYESEGDEADSMWSPPSVTTEDDGDKTDLVRELQVPHINEKSNVQGDDVGGAIKEKEDVSKYEIENTACHEDFKITKQENERTENEDEEKTQSMEDQSACKQANRKPEFTDGLQGIDVSEKKKIEIIKEAYINTNVENETDWDDITLQVSGEEEITDQKFSELVMSFDFAMKEQLQKRLGGSAAGLETGTVTFDANETLDEDSIMYDLCSNMEEKNDKSQSLLITGSKENEEQNKFLPINHNQERVSSRESLTEAVSETVNDSDETNIDALPGKAEKPDASDEEHENLPDDDYVPSGGCDAHVEMVIPENSFSSHSNVNFVCSSETDVHKQPHDILLEAWKDFPENGKKVCEEKNLTKNDTDTFISNENYSFTLIEQDISEHELSHKVTVEDSSQGFSDQLLDNSLASWECVDTAGGVSLLDWDSPRKEINDTDVRACKPTRTRRKRTEGDPTKWLKDVDVKTNVLEDPSVASWNPVQSGTPSWDTSEPELLPRSTSHLNTEREERECVTIEPQPHTGAVRKCRRQKQHTRALSAASTSSGHSDDQEVYDISSNSLPDSDIHVVNSKVSITQTDAETQTQSIDFEAVQQDNNLHGMKIMYCQQDYIPKNIGDDLLPQNGPLTTGKLKLDKGTMTECILDITLVEPFRNLVAFFPKIPEEDLQDVFEKCKYNLNWAMNVLLDSGYEMSDPTDANVNCEEPRELDMDTESTSETTSTGDGRDDRSSFADASDISSDMLTEERTRKFKQSQQPKDLDSKKSLENSFNFPDSVDDRVTRLTGKDFNDLSMTKIKRMKTKKKHGGKKNATVENMKSTENNNNDEDGGGAQYITLVMDPLFASQLNSMFGPSGSFEISGDLTVEDRSVILPLEFCHMIHKYWTDTLDGKFKHETEVLDSLIREDESYARRLQEEEDAEACSRSGNKMENLDQGFQLDPPQRFQEIMDLEQALQLSQGDKVFDNLPFSSRLSLQRLQAEYPEVDPVALREEFARSGFIYKDTSEKLCSRYRTEQGIPKTVIAPEALYRYEQEMIRQAQQNSLAQQEQEESFAVQENEDILPDDPQVYRDEAQLHYRQRQEAFKKAQEASSQGMKAVAAYYARIGNEHSIKLCEANQRASKKILETTNAHIKDANCLDLHHLHVTEALSAAQAFLNERKRVLTARGLHGMQVSLITGRGAHSFGGQARLKPTIKEFLRKSGYIFHEANRGMFTVTLQGEQF